MIKQISCNLYILAYSTLQYTLDEHVRYIGLGLNLMDARWSPILPANIRRRMQKAIPIFVLLGYVISPKAYIGSACQGSKRGLEDSDWLRYWSSSSLPDAWNILRCHWWFMLTSPKVQLSENTSQEEAV